MILYIINLLLMSLGFTNTKKNTTPTLYKQEPKKRYHIYPYMMIILTVAGMIIFAALIVMFCPGNESGVYYNGGVMNV